MLCKNCNYILTGKENFCPNCGAALEKPAFSFAEPKEQKENENGKRKNPVKDSKSSDNIIFPSRDLPKKPTVPEMRVVNIDSDDFPSVSHGDEGEEKKKDNSAGKIFALILVCCTLAVSAFGLADYFGITPGFVQAISTFSQKKNVTQGDADRDFSHGDTVVAPDVEFRQETAYVFSGEGLILRKGPANTFAPLYSLTDLTQVSILGGSLACAGWVYVYCGEKDSYGWLDGSFLCSDVIVESAVSEQNVPIEDIPSDYYREGYVI